MNMSYCRWINTRRDLADCFDSLQDRESMEELSDEEAAQIVAMVKLIDDNMDDLRWHAATLLKEGRGL